LSRPAVRPEDPGVRTRAGWSPRSRCVCSVRSSRPPPLTSRATGRR